MTPTHHIRAIHIADGQPSLVAAALDAFPGVAVVVTPDVPACEIEIVAADGTRVELTAAQLERAA